MNRKSPRLVAAVLGLCLLSSGPLWAQTAQETEVNSGDTAWMLVCCALVLLMTPGLALFYGGMVRSRNVLGTVMQSFFCMALVTVQWVVCGYSLAFGDSVGGLFGNMKHAFLANVSHDQVYSPDHAIPHVTHMTFQLMVAMFTPALITGAFAERVRFGPFCVFVLLWATLVYDPVTHWVWGNGLLSSADGSGWLGALLGTGALDFAGGTVVHISSGASALVFVLLIGKRRNYPEQPVLPNNLVLTMLGVGLLWFGWFGFTGGRALGSDGRAGLAFAATHIGAAAGACSWAIVEWLHRGRVSVLGVATGLVSGLVCVTPAAGFVEPLSALVMGLLVGPICYLFVALIKRRLGYDDSLDAFGVHGIGGTVGALLTGLFFVHSLASLPLEDVSRGAQFLAQLIATVVTWIYAGGVTAVLVLAVDKTMGIRLSEEDEESGLDVTQHGQVGYNL